MFHFILISHFRLCDKDVIFESANLYLLPLPNINRQQPNRKYLWVYLQLIWRLIAKVQLCSFAVLCMFCVIMQTGQERREFQHPNTLWKICDFPLYHFNASHVICFLSVICTRFYTYPPCSKHNLGHMKDIE